MGILPRDEEVAGGARDQMPEELPSLADDHSVDDDEVAHHAFRVDGKAMRIRQTFMLEDPDGNELAKIQERKLSVRDRMAIERNGSTVATVKKALVGIRDRFSIDLEDGGDLKAKGNFVDQEYEIERDGKVIARVSKAWFRVRETYGVETAAGEDDALLLAITVCIDALSGVR